MKRLYFNGAIKILLATNGMVLIAGAMLGPIYALFVEKIGGSLFDASIAGGIFAFTAGITTLLAGNIADKLKEKKQIMVFGYLLMAIGFVLYIFVDSISQLFLVQILIGFAEAIYSPAFDALYSTHIPKNKTGTVWGQWEAINYFSISIGAVTGGIIATLFGFNAIFMAMAVLCILSAVYTHRLPKNIL